MRAPIPSTRIVRVAVTVAVVVGLAAVAWLFYETITLSVEASAAKAREDVAAAQRTQMSAQLSKQEQAIAEANRRLRAAGKPQVSVPAVAPAVPDSSIARAVAAYLALNP
ncbi:MAG: hypothetical protein ACXVXZ_00425, partial [Mycobacteriaceae bacterium]